jgi:peptidoglycan/xylan/chitin deacetylase (PgdA/CDA1 family)
MKTDRLPEYYHALRPFRAGFERGVPILTYHKLGPRPTGVRLKGLYVGAALFRKQMAELGAAGFTTPPLSELAAATENQRHWIGLTFDDGFRNVLRHGLEPLERHGFHAIQFLVSDLVGKSNEWEQRDGEVAEMLMDDAEVRVWLAAGHRIGSHTRTHPRLTRLTPAQAREEIVSSRKALEDRFGVRIEHFCYPYGDWNEAVRDLVAEAGYLTACTTEPGVNTGGSSPLTLRRFTARYPSRNFKALWRRLRTGI